MSDNRVLVTIWVLLLSMPLASHAQHAPKTTQCRRRVLAKGYEAEQDGKFEHALAIYARGMLTEPDYYLLPKRSGYVLMTLGRFEEAVVHFSKSLRLRPENRNTWILRRRALAFADRHEEAIADFDQAYKMKPKTNESDLEVCVRRGDCFWALGNHNQAFAQFALAISHDRDASLPRYRRSLIHMELGNYREAVRDSTYCIEKYPKWWKAYLARGDAYVTMGSLDHALDDYNKTIQLDPDNVDAFVGRVLVHQVKREFEKSERDYTQAIKLDPASVNAHFGRALIYVEMDRLPDALRDLDTAIRQKQRQLLLSKMQEGDS